MPCRDVPRLTWPASTASLPHSSLRENMDSAFRFHAVMLGVLADHLRLNRRSRWRHALGACHHRCLLRQALDHLDATVIGETGLDGEACNPIVSDGVHEVAVAIRAYSRGGDGKRIGAPVHFQ